MEKEVYQGERLQKVLAAAGLGSRRSCEGMIRSGRVDVNGVTVTAMGTRVDPVSDRIEVDGIPVEPVDTPGYYLLNKPPGYLTTLSDPHGRPTILDIFSEEGRFFPVGRLDMDSRGLLLLTDNGFIAHRLLHPSFGVDKTYMVRVSGRVGPGALKRLREGVELEEGKTSPARVKVVGTEGETTVLEFVIHQGWRRQIRRMCDVVGLRVIDLMRTRMGPLSIEGIKEGDWRELGPSELKSLFKSVGL